MRPSRARGMTRLLLRCYLTLMKPARLVLNLALRKPTLCLVVLIWEQRTLIDQRAHTNKNGHRSARQLTIVGALVFISVRPASAWQDGESVPDNTLRPSTYADNEMGPNGNVSHAI